MTTLHSILEQIRQLKRALQAFHTEPKTLREGIQSETSSQTERRISDI